MNKFLLSMAAVALAGGAAFAAEDVTLSVSNATNIVGEFVEETTSGTNKTAAHYQPVNSFSIGDYNFTCVAGATAAASQNPALYHLNATPTVRLYLGSQMTIAIPEADEVNSISFTIANVKGMDNLTVSTGAVTFSATNKSLVWSNTDGEKTVTFTLPSAKGSDGANPNLQISAFVMSGDVVEPEPGPDPEPSDNIGLVPGQPCGWTLNVDGTVPEGLTYIWTFNNYGLVGSANVGGTAYVCDGMWAVSPEVEIEAESTLAFDHAAKFQTSLKTLCGLYIREAGTTDWTQLTIPEWPAAGTWDYVTSGAIDLAAYAEKTVEFGFKYASETDAADTWEIKNFVISSNSGVAAVEAVDGEASYFDLQGRRVAAPANGLYIKVQGGKATKVLVK